MTCECITVEYPSDKLLRLVDSAIENQSIDLKIAKIKNDEEDAEVIARYNLCSRLGKWFHYCGYEKNSDGSLNVDWINQRYNETNIKNRLSELRKIKLAAESANVVRMTGDCLARIDEWAGN